MISASERTLDWDGLVNGRDLGGIATPNGPIQRGRLVRTASVHTLTAQGWLQLDDFGVSTIVDLRHPWEIDRAAPAPGRVPAGVLLHAIALEPPGYVEEWTARGEQWKLATPRFYAEFLEDHGERLGAVLSVIADAAPGAVLVHCHGGRDRAGLVTAMALRMLGADLDDIAADHWASFDRDEPLEVTLGQSESAAQVVAAGSPAPDRAAFAAIIADALDRFPPESCFADASEAERVRATLVDRLCRPR